MRQPQWPKHIKAVDLRKLTLQPKPHTVEMTRQLVEDLAWMDTIN